MKTRATLIEQLLRHDPLDVHEARMRARILEFVEAHEDCFERSQLAGHITGSAWVVDAGRACAVLLHHRKLDKWLQPGGHCDGDADVLRVALREANEETGLTRLRAVSEEIFDVDAHSIPERRGTPAHVHYDVRYLVEADPAEPLGVSEESREVRWVALDQVLELNTDDSVLRMVRKSARRSGYTA